MNKIVNFCKEHIVFYLSVIGNIAVEILESFGKLCLFVYSAISSVFSRPFYLKNTTNVFLYALIRGLPIVGLAGFFVGAVIALQSYNGFSRMNAQDSIPIIIAISFARELGPVVAGFTMCGSIGASMASELSGMVVNNQISAMRTLLVNPFKFLIVPNILASILVMPILAFITDVIGLFGGFIICVYVLDFSAIHYINSAFSLLTVWDVCSGLFKSVFFGLVMSVLSCYFGYHSERDALGIGKATISAVTTSSAAILFINYLLTAILF